MPHRYFTPDIADGRAALSGDDARHLAKVMRAKVGETVILCDGNALEYTAVITEITSEQVLFSVEEGYPSVQEPGVDVTLFVGYPKQDKLEQIVQHGVELGANRIVPFFSRYCVAAPKNEEKKNVRQNRIAFEAAKQCGRGRIPTVEMPLPNFRALCEALKEYDLALFFYECGGVPLRNLISPEVCRGKRVAIITGAEGGFAPEEAEAVQTAGAKSVGLGPRILRCETAPLAALTAVMTLAGEMENR